jgi:uncharacterized membrane protein YccC
MTDSEIRRRATSHLLAGSILEDESLTTDLTDHAAKLLLDWGLTQVEAIAQQAEGLLQEELNAHLAALRRTMKHIGRQAGEAAPEAQVEQVRALLAEAETEQNLEAEIDA